MRRAPIRGAWQVSRLSRLVVGLTAALAASAGGAGMRAGAAAAPALPPTTKVALFSSPYPDPLAARVEAELAAVGIAVRRLETPPEAQLEAAIARELAAGASAAIRVIPRSRGTEIWAGDTTARVLRARSLRTDTSDAALSVIALRTVEFLRASLLDVKRRGGTTGPAIPAAPTASASPAAGKPTGEPGAREVPGSERPPPAERPSAPAPAAELPPPPIDSGRDVIIEQGPARTFDGGAARENALARVAQSPPRPAVEPTAEAPPTTVTRPGAARDALGFEIMAGPATLASPGGIAPPFAVAAMARGHGHGGKGVELFALFPLTASVVSPAVGRVEVRTAVFGASALFRLAPRGPVLTDAALGVSGVMLRAVGSTGPVTGGDTLTAATGTAWKAAGHARFGVGVPIANWLALRADVIGGLCTSRVVLGYRRTDTTGKVTDVEVATWGTAFVAGTAGLQASW